MANADESPGSGRYRFGDVVVDEAAHALSRAGQAQSIEPKAFAVLLALLRRPGELIGRDDLLDQVWGHRHVTPGVLTRAIAQLRSVLGDDPQNPRYIQTRHALGYCFVGELLPEPEAIPGMPLAGSSAFLLAEQEEGTARPQRMEPEADDKRRDALRPLHWRPRHWLLASLLAAVVFAISVWGGRHDVSRPASASVAVLPFTSLGPDRSEDYFAEGLAVEMHDALAGVPGLVVAAQMSPALATAREADIKALGQRLGVATVLDASVRREGDRVRINARLSDTGTGYTLWSRSYDREMAGIFAIQSEIADEVVNALLDVLPEERKALADRLSPTKSAVAFDLYLKGIRRLSRQDRDAPGEAIGFFQQALARDGSFVRAQAGVCLSEVFRYEHERIAGALEKAREACAHAESLSGGSGQASLALAKLHHAQGNLGEAGKFYARAEADPARKAEALVGMALIHGSQGRHAEALRDFGQAIEASPGDDVIHSYIGYYHYLAGDLPAAIAAYRKAIEISPGDAGYWSTLGTLLANVGESDAAADALDRSLGIEPDNHLALNNLGEIRYQSGDYAGATALYRKAASLEPADYIPWGNLGRTLLADAATMDQAKHAFEQAALRARAYVDARPGDATALAALAWFSVNLGQRDEARELVRRSEALGGDPIEAALYNAMTFVALGELDQSRKRIASAREAGLSETRIASNTVLRGLAMAGP